MKYQRSSASLIGALFLIAGSLCAQASPATAEKIIQEGQTRSQVMRHLNTLTNRIGPRLTSSDNLIEACNWAVETFKGFGIENARLYEWGTYPVGLDRGTMIGRMVSPKTMKLDLTTPSWTAGTAGLTRGRVVAFPEPESATGDRSAPGDGGAKGGRGTEDAPDATAQPMDLKGAWVLFPRMTRGRRPAISTDELKKAGALGSIYPSYGQTNDLVLTGGSSRISWDDLPDFPTIMLRRDQISEINAELDKGEEVILEFDIENEFKEGPIPVYNVIADIVGTEF
ncbi:MAG: hypothetical protein KDB18_14390, partial [Salinibacterium sp.]|nr:hypothetical protein [Salinibacterium sp.]